MKNILYIITIAVNLIFLSCSETSNIKAIDTENDALTKDTVHTGVITYLTKHFYENTGYSILDTVTYDDIANEKSKILARRNATDSALLAMPDSLKKAELALAEAIKDRDENTSKTIENELNEIVELCQSNLTETQIYYQDFELLKNQDKANLKFYDTFNDSDGVAFFLLDCDDRDVIEMLVVTPKGEVLVAP